MVCWEANRKSQKLIFLAGNDKNLYEGPECAGKLVSLVENDRKSFLKDLGMLGGNRKSQKMVPLVENDRKSFLKDLGRLDGNRKSQRLVSLVENLF